MHRALKAIYIHIIDDCTKCNIISFHTHGNSTMYWIRAHLALDITSANIDMIAIDYELLHHWLRHSSKDVFRAVHEHVKDFPSMTILSVEPVCPGCQLGKQPNHPFVASDTHKMKPFESVHSDLKSFKTESYHRSTLLSL